MTLMKWTNHPLMNEMMNGMQRRPVSHSCDFNRPAANIIDNEKDFTIELAVPGMAKDDFSLNLEDDILTISVERKEEEVKEDRNFTRREFRYDEFSRSFSLPDIVDQEKIKADYQNGVLSVMLPKSAEAKVKGREIKIS
ncbi:MAG: Hsp20/alpha crystallin family protein [Bacteroidetes bacterium]|nr:MAG: Hsp20/alpha crystallin family protein [Bacteroidota bacterium]